MVTPLILASSLLVPVDSGAAFVCWAAAGAAVIAWPWCRLYWAMRVNEHEHPEEQARSWWQRWAWGSPPQPQRKTWLDRFIEGISLCSAAGLGLIVLAWVCGLL